MVDFTLPPLTPRPVYHWLEANLIKWRERLEQRSQTNFFIRNTVYRLLQREIRSGRKTPFIVRMWRRIGNIVLSAFSPAARTRGFPKLIAGSIEPDPDMPKRFRAGYLVTNFVTGLIGFWLFLLILPPLVETLYIVTTYRHTKYENVRITSHYRDFDAGPHIFAVHGLIDNDPDNELYIQIGPSFWFQEYNPENIFGKISDGAICNFSGYGTLIRMPLGLRYLSKGSLYALNPWAVDATCHQPNTK